LDSDLTAKIISNVFPLGSSLTWNVTEVPPENRFWIIPGKQGPRWIIPQNPKHGWPVLKYWRPYDLSSRLKWMGLIAAYRTGQLGLVPGVLAIGISGLSDKTNWNHLGWTGKRAPVPVIYVGTPGPTRKAVVHLVDATLDKARGVAKIPLEKLAAKNILHEADILQQLSQERPGIAPRLQYIDKVKGISVQDSINGRQASRRLTQAHLNWLRGLQTPEVKTSLREQSKSLKKQLINLKGLSGPTRHMLNTLLDELDDPTPLPTAWVHGDFAPWNLKWVEDDRLVAVDWEEARPSSLPTSDLVYYYIIQDFLFCNNQPGKTWQQLQGFVNSSLARSYIGKFCHMEKLLNSIVLFTLTELLISRSLTVNGAPDRFCMYLQDLVQEQVGNL